MLVRQNPISVRVHSCHRGGGGGSRVTRGGGLQGETFSDASSRGDGHPGDPEGHAHLRRVRGPDQGLRRHRHPGARGRLPPEHQLQGGRRGQEGRPPLHHRSPGIPGEGRPGQGRARPRPDHAHQRRHRGQEDQAAGGHVRREPAGHGQRGGPPGGGPRRGGRGQGPSRRPGTEPQLHADDLAHQRHHREDQGQGGRVRGPASEPHDPQHGL